MPRTRSARYCRPRKQVSDEGIAYPLLVGRTAVIEQRIERLGLRLRHGQNCEIINIQSDQHYAEFCTLLHERSRRLGVSVQESKTLVRTDSTVVAALLVEHGDADAMETAVSEALRQTFFGDSVLKGSANLLVMPNDDAAHITYSLLKVLGGGDAVGSLLLGANCGLTPWRARLPR